MSGPPKGWAGFGALQEAKRQREERERERTASLKAVPAEQLPASTPVARPVETPVADTHATPVATPVVNNHATPVETPLRVKTQAGGSLFHNASER